MLQLPVTLRAPRLEEMPDRSDLEELLARRKKANFTEGYRLKPNTTPQLPFTFFAEININNSRLWSLFGALTAMVPGNAIAVYSLGEEEPVLTGSYSKEVILERFTRYEPEFSQDCLLSCGLLHHSKTSLVEISITDTKYIRFWASDHQSFEAIMQRFHLQQVPDIAFVDEYPKIVEPLQRFVPAARRPEEVIWQLNRIFQLEDTL